MTGRRLMIYGNWSAYDELSDGVPLTEELAMRQFGELLRLRACGVRFDAYLMDAFWFDPAGGYRSWRKPNWPDGPARWLDACRANEIIPGLWFTANTLCHIEPATAWLDSADEDRWGLCCFQGGFLDDYLDVLDYWYLQGIRIFKIDFASFTAAPPSLKSRMSVIEIRHRNIEAFRNGLAQFRESHPEAILMAFNGFESVEYMDRTDRPLQEVMDLRWLEVFDSIYSGDPRPADLPTTSFWRSVDIYGDHMTRVLEYSGVPLRKIDNCGFMAGPTGTCYRRRKALWQGMLLLTLARGGNLTVLYGDLSLFDDDDAQWIATVLDLFSTKFNGNEAKSFGGIPGKGQPYGWVVGQSLCVVVNPGPEVSKVLVPSGDWQIAFSDSGFKPYFEDGLLTIGPFQIAFLSHCHISLGVQSDFESAVMAQADFKVIEHTASRQVIESQSGELSVFVRQLNQGGDLVRTYSGAHSAAEALQISAFQGDVPCATELHTDRVVWSGMSWASADITGIGPTPVRITVSCSDLTVSQLEVEIWCRSQQDAVTPS